MGDKEIYRVRENQSAFAGNWEVYDTRQKEKVRDVATFWNKDRAEKWASLNNRRESIWEELRALAIEAEEVLDSEAK